MTLHLQSIQKASSVGLAFTRTQKSQMLQKALLSVDAELDNERSQGFGCLNIPF